MIFEDYYNGKNIFESLLGFYELKWNKLNYLHWSVYRAVMTRKQVESCLMWV